MLKGLYYDVFTKIKEYIMKERDKMYTKTMTEIDETNKYCIGKLWLKLLMIEDFPYQNAKIFININLEPFLAHTKKSSKLNDRFSYEFNQQFLMYFLIENFRPVHNYFSILNLDIINKDPNASEPTLTSFKIPLPDFIQEPYISGKVRLPFHIDNLNKSGLVNSKSKEAALFENK
jgi:hypothetical protein